MRVPNAKWKKSLAARDLFSSLEKKEFDTLMTVCRPVTVGAGEVIMREGETGDSMFLFASGTVDVTKSLTLKTGTKDYSSVEKSFVKLDAGKVSFFGDMALFENETRSATITASTDCLLFEVKRRDFEDLCGRHPALGYKLVKKIAAVLCERVRKGNQDILKLSTALSIALSKT
ncbi:MAG: cyclic nucleotide-binding domain-containing protein [Spirochaetales bacterium]|nr:cyclic nucleotide-binding domain-containing protein [Spirochaetales bacterium]